ncbi:uncharacterized protein LOC107885496 [Acyrthosiphon pisum]|uniref:Uncharacterized protein n=1 Tax=Acyrthosiphon pisum TaxID=7029 RepID=A0A8R2JSM3_ACYPI|nr:uncharacterized protein LOC107885496 [Acyrthosiphon pisum]
MKKLTLIKNCLEPQEPHSISTMSLYGKPCIKGSMYERDVTEDGNVSSALYVKKGKYGKPPIKGMMYIPDFKEDSKVPCSLPRAAGIKRKRVQTDAYSDRKFKKEKHEKLSIVVQRINVMSRKTFLSIYKTTKRDDTTVDAKCSRYLEKITSQTYLSYFSYHSNDAVAKNIWTLDTPYELERDPIVQYPLLQVPVKTHRLPSR